MEFLPSADITERSLEHFLVFRDELGVAGAVGLEVYGETALLRSLVVSRDCSGLGIGKRLLAAAEELARDLHVSSIYLLTTNQTRYFEQRTFRQVPREEAPAAIQATSEFSSLCTSTSALLVKP